MGEYNVVMRWNMLIFRRWDDYFSVFCVVEVTKWGVRVQKAGSHSEVAARLGPMCVPEVRHAEWREEGRISFCRLTLRGEDTPMKNDGKAI